MQNYEISVAWKEGERSEAHAGGKTPIEMTMSQEPDTQHNSWTPEDLLASAVAGSMLNLTHYFAEKNDIKIRSYMSNATAIMEEVPNGRTLARVMIEIAITIINDSEEPSICKAVNEAEISCPVSNSLQCPVNVLLHVTVEP